MGGVVGEAGGNLNYPGRSDRHKSEETATLHIFREDLRDVGIQSLESTR